jgi:brefeldin A-resistance guanine nucleotide exchange factor 1
MPEEHKGQLSFEFAWKELLMRSRQFGMWFCACFPVLRSPRFSGELMICNSPVFDKEMFRTIWKHVISAITFAFMTFDDDYIIERAIAGFRQGAILAGYFQFPDYVVSSLSQVTSLLSENLLSEVPKYPVVEVEGQSITVSSLAVSFGARLKGQMAAVVLFNICHP